MQRCVRNYNNKERWPSAAKYQTSLAQIQVNFKTSEAVQIARAHITQRPPSSRATIQTTKYIISRRNENRFRVLFGLLNVGAMYVKKELSATLLHIKCQVSCAQPDLSW